MSDNKAHTTEEINKELLKACQWIDNAIRTGNVRGLFDEEKEQLTKAIEMAESAAPETAGEQQPIQTLINALERIKATYDNVEDAAGVIAKEALGQYYKLID